MSFLAASRLWLLLLVAAAAVAYLLAQARRRHYAVRFTNLELLDVVAPRRPGWRRHLPAIAFLLMLTSLVVALARPARDERVPRQRAAVVLALDTSQSMAATDVLPTRLEAAQAAARSFIDRLPRRFELGLVAFAGSANVLVTPSRDHEQARRAIETLELAPRTAIGEAIYTSLASVAELRRAAGRRAPPARIVLMSDGETTTGRPNAEAARAARQARVPVSTIAYGTDEGFVTVEGDIIPVPVNAEALQEIAETTGGTFFEAASAEELQEVYQDIGQAVGYDTEQREIGWWFVGLAMLFATAASVGSLLWFSRLP